MKTLALFLSVQLSVFSINEVQAAGASSQWSSTLSGAIEWQEVTPLGDLLVGTRDGLVGVNPETGETLWQRGELAGIPLESIRPVEGSPYYRFDAPDSIYFIDPLTGDMVFNSLASGINELISTHFLFDLDGMLVAGQADGLRNRILVFVDLQTGKELWRLEQDIGRILAVESLDSNSVLMVGLFDMYKVDATNGSVAWKKPTTPETAGMTGKMDGFLKAFAETMIADMEIDINFFRDPQSNDFYIASAGVGDGDSVYISYHGITGRMNWEKALRAYGGGMEFLDKGIITLPLLSTSATQYIGGYKVNLISRQTGEGSWGKKGKGLVIKTGVDNHFILEGDRLFLSARSGANSFLYLIDTQGGEIVHKKPTKMKGGLLAIFETSAGILCLGDEETNLYDPVSGAFKLKRSIATTPHLTAIRHGKLYAYDYKSGVIEIVDTDTGAMRELGKFKLKFGDKEKPSRIEAREKGLLLSSSQNLALIGYDGRIAFHSHHPAPRVNGLARALYYAQGVRAAIISAESYFVTGAVASAALTPEFQEADPVERAIVGGVGMAYGELAQEAQGVAAESFRRANQRFKATMEADDYALVLSKQDKAISLLKVDKDAGSILKSVDLGKDKKPDYSLDAVTGRMFLKTGNNELTAYQL